MRNGMIPWVIALWLMLACGQDRERTAPAIRPQDSVAAMVSYGVNTLISDSGIIKYRIVAERWEMNPNRNPSRWIFDKGLFLEQFDLTLHVQSYIQCDTAYYYDTNKLWELHGRVRILSKNGVRFKSEELFWDERSHELYSNKFSHIITPERELQGNSFRSDERMTKYHVSNTKGAFDKGDVDKSPRENMTESQSDSAMSTGRQPYRPNPKRKTIPLTHTEQ